MKNQSLQEWVLEEQEKNHMCECGCGQIIIVKPQHRSRGLPKYIQGHFGKSKEGREMSSKIHKGKNNSEETKTLIRNKRKLQINIGMRGKHHTEEAKEKNRQAHLGTRGSFTSFKKGNIPHNKGLTKENNIGMKKTSEKMSGKNNHQWKGGISTERDVFYRSDGYKDWRNSIFKRDDYICQNCGKTGYMNPHHIIPWRDCKDTPLALHIMNGITLCKKCHKKTIKKEYNFSRKFFKITRKEVGSKWE